MVRTFRPAVLVGATILVVFGQAPNVLAEAPSTPANEVQSVSISKSIQARELRFDPTLKFAKSRKLATTKEGGFWSVPTSDPARVCLMMVPTGSAATVATTCGTTDDVASKGLPLAVNHGSESVEAVLVTNQVTADLQRARPDSAFAVADPNLLLVRNPRGGERPTLEGSNYKISGISGATLTPSFSEKQPSARESTLRAKDIYDSYYHGKTSVSTWHYAPIRKSIVGATASYPIQGNVWVEADKGYSAVGPTYVRISFSAMTSGSRCKVEQPVPKFYLDCTTVHW